MNTRKYIKLFLLDEAVKVKGEYQLDISYLPEYELKRFIDHAIDHDITLRELVLDRLQELVNENLPIIEAQQKYDSGLRPVHDAVNGEVTWINRGAA